jgi:hypothetical protein
MKNGTIMLPVGCEAVELGKQMVGARYVNLLMERGFYQSLNLLAVCATPARLVAKRALPF